MPGPYQGLRLGLFGGSFNPAHDGHAHVALSALKSLRLDAVWWLPALGNPLKGVADDYPGRLASAVQKARAHPRFRVSDLERQIGTRYSRDTLRRLLPRLQGAQIVWIMGADNLAGFHRWGGWQEIAGLVPIAVIARPGQSRKALSSPFVRRFGGERLPERDAASLPASRAPAWVWLSASYNPESSTALRESARSRNPFRGV